MQPTPPTPGRTGRLALVSLALVVLLAAVAVSSHGGFGHARSAAPGRTFVDYAFSAFLVLFVLAIPVAGYAYLLQARETDLRKRRRFEIRVGLSLLGLLIVFGLLMVRVYAWHDAGALFHVHVGGGDGVRQAQPGATPTSYTPRFQWPVVAATALVLAAGAIALLRSRRPAAAAGCDPLAPEDELAVSIGDAIDDLEREPDARRAVIAAYARMEGVLARRGLARRPSETPLEYLRRALLDLTSSRAAVERLTRLFEGAKFSDRPVPDAAKHEAIGALREIRDGLGT
ncbi:MAG TPA: DUF4129 domain-containing protein [Gaiellaceae bacterium]|nr:DUF4129 domain-containing protein [Gaiellaceae bacterium]